MLLIGIGFIGFGVAIASVLEDTQGFSLIMNFVVSPMLLLSGSFFPVSNFPDWLKPLTYIDPLTYGVDGLRSSLIGFSQFPLLLDISVLSAFAFIMVILGSWLFSKTEV